MIRVDREALWQKTRAARRKAWEIGRVAAPLLVVGAGPSLESVGYLVIGGVVVTFVVGAVGLIVWSAKRGNPNKVTPSDSVDKTGLRWY